MGEGEGAGFTVNLPVPAGAGDEVWISLIERVVVPLAYAFEPQLVLISPDMTPTVTIPSRTARSPRQASRR